MLRLRGLIDGQPSPFDGQYVVEYDPSRNGAFHYMGRKAWPVCWHLVTTPDVDQATLMTAEQAYDLFMQVDTRHPTRPEDGRPNRPLMAYTTELCRPGNSLYELMTDEPHE